VHIRLRLDVHLHLAFLGVFAVMQLRRQNAR
jgi:hypothetical protein